MILSYIRSTRKARLAARNYRILSALDDDALHDIGLDRRTLRAFCDTGCAQTTISAGQPGTLLVGMPPLRPVWG